MDRAKQILLLEDDVEFGVKLSMDLEAAGFDVHRHTTASKALEFVAEHHIDVVVADILIKVDGELVQDGGVKLISRLYQVMQHPAPIIAMSSMFRAQFGATEAVTTVKTVGAKAILAKPFRTAELTFLINKLLSKEGRSAVF